MRKVGELDSKNLPKCPQCGVRLRRIKVNGFEPIFSTNLYTKEIPIRYCDKFIKYQYICDNCEDIFEDENE